MTPFESSSYFLHQRAQTHILFLVSQESSPKSKNTSFICLIASLFTHSQRKEGSKSDGR